MDEWSVGLVTRLWSLVDQRVPYPWKIDASAQQRLIDILHPPQPIFTGTNEELNSSVRTYVSPLLRRRDPVAVQLASWIIKDWGGIRTIRDPTIRSWMD